MLGLDDDNTSYSSGLLERARQKRRPVILAG